MVSREYLLLGQDPGNIFAPGLVRLGFFKTNAKGEAKKVHKCQTYNSPLSPDCFTPKLAKALAVTQSPLLLTTQTLKLSGSPQDGGHRAGGAGRGATGEGEFGSGFMA